METTNKKYSDIKAKIFYSPIITAITYNKCCGCDCRNEDVRAYDFEDDYMYYCGACASDRGLNLKTNKN